MFGKGESLDFLLSFMLSAGCGVLSKIWTLFGILVLPCGAV